MFSNNIQPYKDNFSIIILLQMCGIFTLLNNHNHIPQSIIQSCFENGKGRGPEFSSLSHCTINAQLGFHRLAINGLNDQANQPIRIQNITLICNGEIYNYNELYKTLNVSPITDSDCEVIIHMYLKYGIEYTLRMLDGVFSFVLIDTQFNGLSKMYVARDPYGVRPLYQMNPISRLKSSINHLYGFASEIKGLYDIYNYIKDINGNKRTMDPIHASKYPDYSIDQFPPGTFSYYELPYEIKKPWKFISSYQYHSHGFHSNMYTDYVNTNTISNNIRKHLTNAVHKRCSATDRPIACLLSGGLDSSLITAIVNNYHIKKGLPTLETYSIGIEGSDDLKYAKIVADYLGTKHTEVVLSEFQFMNAIPEVIKGIESYDTTTVRASIGNWLLGKYISEHSNAKVIFNGDGSDELSGGYLYMGSAPDEFEFDKECRRLLRDIHTFDVLRSDKSISSHGLEPRTPFLDREWTEYYLSIPPHVRFHTNDKLPEKYLIRKAFSKEEYAKYDDKPLLPDSVIWRRKEAFSDGVSTQTRSLYQIIQEHVGKRVDLGSDYSRFTHLPPQTPEQMYYRTIFEEHYAGLGHIIPYLWMPKYIDATDSSARTLSVY